MELIGPVVYNPKIPRQGLNPQQNVGRAMDGLDGDTCSAGLALEGPISVAQPPNPICYPPSPSQPSQPMPCSVLAPPKHRPGPPFPGTYLLLPLPCQPLSLSPPASGLPACLLLSLPSSQFLPPAPAKLAISKRTDDVLSDLPLPHPPQNSILWATSAYTT